MDATATLRHLEEEATARIRAAFASTEAPPCSEFENHCCPECEEIAARFAGLRWEEITVATLRSPLNPPIALLAPAAFRYCLPALMLGCIEAPMELDCLPQEVIGWLSPPNGKATAQDGERLSGLTGARADAILAFLRVFELREKMDSGLPDETVEYAPVPRPLERAIRYWTMQVGPAR